VHPIQVLQAREAGASAILIIVRALSDDEIKTLAAAATAAGLDADHALVLAIGETRRW